MCLSHATFWLKPPPRSSSRRVPFTRFHGYTEQEHRGLVLLPKVSSKETLQRDPCQRH